MKIRYLILALILSFSFTACQQVTDKIKQDIKRTDSLASIAVDSISQQLAAVTSEDTTAQQQASEPKKTQKFNATVAKATFSQLLSALESGDSLTILQMLALDDSLLTISSQGIFNVLQISHWSELKINLLNSSTPILNCNVQYVKQLPQMVDTGWTQSGCFVAPVKHFGLLTAVLDLEQEVGVPVSERIVQIVNQYEPLVSFEALNTYLGWEFYFIQQNGKYRLLAINFNPD